MSRASEKLKRWREEQGLTQTEAANKVEVGQASWSAWESGQKRPSIEQLVQLAALTMASKYAVAIHDWVETDKQRDARRKRKSERRRRARRESPPATGTG